MELAIIKLETHKEENNYRKFNSSIEPAEPFTKQQMDEFLNYEGKSAKEILLSHDYSEYIKYRIMYGLRSEENFENTLLLAKLLRKENSQYVSNL